MSSRYLPVDSFNTGTITAGSSGTFHRTFGYNQLNVVKIKVTPSGSSTGYTFKLYKEAALTHEVLGTKANVIGNFYAPTTKSGGEALEGFVVPYEDLDGGGQVHVVITNNDAVSRNYDVEITCEGVALVGVAGEILAEGTNPRIVWNETDAGTDVKMWDAVASSGSLLFRTRTDVDAAGNTWLTISRTTTTVTGVNFTPAVTFSSSIIGGTIGPTSSHQHTLPDVASDTVALIGATQTLGGKTLTSPTINAGALLGTFTGDPTLSGNPVLSGLPTVTNTTDSSSTSTGALVIAGGVGIAKTLYVGTSIFAPSGSTATNSVGIGEANTGFYQTAAHQIGITINGTLEWIFKAGRLESQGASQVLALDGDAIIGRFASDVAGMQRTTIAQEWRVYGTTTGPRYITLRHDGTDGYVGSRGTGDLYFYDNDTANWGIISGNLDPVSDNSKSFGISSRRASNVYSVLATIGLATNRQGDHYVGSNANAYYAMDVASTGTAHGEFDFFASRGTQASRTIIANGDNIGRIIYLAYDGSALQGTARIDVLIDGAVTSGQRPPSRMEFYTSAANTTPGLALTIESTQRLTTASGIGVGKASEANRSLAIAYGSSANAVFYNSAGNSATAIQDAGSTGTSSFTIAPSGTIMLTLTPTAATVGGTLQATTITAATQFVATTTGEIFSSTGTSTLARYVHYGNTGGDFYLGQDRSTGGGILSGSSAYAAVLGSGGNTELQFGTGNAVRWAISNSAGSYAFYSIGGDNSYDLGKVATRVRTGYFGTAIAVGTTPAAAGTVRLENNGGLYWARSTGAAAYSGILLNSSNILTIGSPGTNYPAGIYLDSLGTININQAGNDVDTVISSDTNANALIVDAGGFNQVGWVSIGSAGGTWTSFNVDAPAYTSVGSVWASRAFFNNTNAITTPASTTVGVAANLAITEPNLTVGSSGAITVAASLYIQAAPTEGETNASLYIAEGLTYLGGNVGIGTAKFGTSAAKVLALSTGTAPSSAPADTVQLYSSDVSAGNCALSWYQEMAPYAGIAVASTTKVPVVVNGTVYYLLATTVA